MQGHFRVSAIVLSVLVLGLTLGLQPAVAEVLPSPLKIEKVLDSTAEIADLAVTPTGDLWILEKTGRIRFFVHGIEGTPFTVPVSTACDSGLLGVAFAPDFFSSRLAFIYYIDPSGTARVDKVLQKQVDDEVLGLLFELEIPAPGGTIITVGTTTSGCNTGGGLTVGPDGMLYVAVGDLGVPADAQEPTSNSGKVLRATLDGGVPGDNPSGTLVWATGFRDPRGLTINPATDRAGGTVYLADVGVNPDVYDELNAVNPGGNHGWSPDSGQSGKRCDPFSANPGDACIDNELRCNGASDNPDDLCTDDTDCPNGACADQCVLGNCIDHKECDDSSANPGDPCVDNELRCDNASDNPGDPCTDDTDCPNGACADQCVDGDCVLIDPINPLVAGNSLFLDDVELLSGTKLRHDAEGSVAYTCSAGGTDEIRQAFLTGAEMDGLDPDRSPATLYDPDGDFPPPPDPGCPKRFTALAETGDGYLYAANNGANPGIWRIWPDEGGPREVSAPGSPFPLTLAKVEGSSNLKIGWEKLGLVNLGRPDPHGGQRTEIYRVWEGPFPIDGTFSSLAGIHDTDGTPDPDSQGRMAATISPPAGSSYYLVSAQGDNMDQLGAGRSVPAADYCNTIGWGTAVGLCAEDWVEPLTDWNPNSPTYKQQITLSDFRGKVVRMDISAENCSICKIMAESFLPLDLFYQSRDLVVITVLMKSFSFVPFTEEECEAGVFGWSLDPKLNLRNPVVCATSLAVPNQYKIGGGTPQSFWIDQGNVRWQEQYGYDTTNWNFFTEEGWIINEVNPETCE